MRNRKRRDWHVRVYKYWAEPRGELPDAAWAQARAMRQVWNAMAEMRERAAGEAAGLEGEVARDVWVRYRRELSVYIRSEEVTGRLGWAAREFVFDRFLEADRAALKQNRGLRARLRLDRLIIPHRFSGGGVPPDRLFSVSWGRVRLRPVPPDAYIDARRESVRRRITRGEFRLGDETLAFSTLLHRPIPENSVVKGFAWCGRLHPTRGWRWSINITVEQPPPPPREKTGRVCALDLGWRVMGDYLRVAVIGDSSGNFNELRLPLAETGTAFTRRYGLPDSFKDVQRMTARLDALVDECKRALPEVLPTELPDDLRTLVERLRLMRQGGLIRLLRAVERQAETGDGPELAGAAETLRDWLAMNDALRKRRQDTLDRLAGRRRWLYGNVAAWLARRYDRIVWEGDLRVGNLTRRPDDSANKYALAGSRKYRNWAALGELRQSVRSAAAKEGVELVDAPTAYSTVTCARCGARCEPSDKLIITCPRGHEFDQDVNAAENLLAEAKPDVRHGRDPVPIPENLRGVVVPVGE